MKDDDDIDDLKRKYMDSSGRWRWDDMPIDVYHRVDRYDSRGVSYSIGPSYPTQYTDFERRLKNENEEDHKTPDVRPMTLKYAWRAAGIFLGGKPTHKNALKGDGLVDEWGASAISCLRRRRK